MYSAEDGDKGYQRWIDFFLGEMADEEEDREDVDQPAEHYETGNKS